MKRSWLTVIPGTVLAILVVLLWITLNRREEILIRRKVDAEANKLASLIDADLRGRVPALERIALRWESRGGTPQNEFYADVSAYLEDLPGFQAIEWVDRDFIVRWILPSEGNEAAINLDLAFEINRLSALMAAKESHEPTISAPIDLVQGGSGFLVYYPIYLKEEFDGFILAVFRLEEWLDYVFAVNISDEEFSQFDFTVAMEEQALFQRVGSERDARIAPDWDTPSTSRVSYLSRTFHVNVWPTRAFLDANGSILPELAAIGGFFISILISIVIHLYFKASDEAARQRRTAREKDVLSRRLSDILEGTHVGTWEWNVQTGETIFNDHWAEIIGYSLDELAPTSIETWMKYAHPDDLEISGRLLEEHFQGRADYYECEARMKHKSGSWIWVLDRGKVASWTADGKPLLMSGTHQDITLRKENESRVAHMATHDNLTGLPRLPLAKERLERAMGMARRHKGRSGVLFIDLDGFKAVNDTYGHDAGDQLLKTVAERLRSVIRESDTAARIGGDEFLIILSEIASPDVTGAIAEKVLSTLTRPIPIAVGDVQVGASMGIAVFPDHGDDVSDLIKKSDNAMYKIKRAGKNGYALWGED